MKYLQTTKQKWLYLFIPFIIILTLCLIMLFYKNIKTFDDFLKKELEVYTPLLVSLESLNKDSSDQEVLEIYSNFEKSTQKVQLPFLTGNNIK